MKFKTDNERGEYTELTNKNPRLKSLLQVLDDYVDLNFKKEITITELYRTQEEFDALYAQTPVEKRPGRSPHQDWSAADIRSRDFTEEELNKIKTMLNTFIYKDGSKPVCIIHAIAGGAMHVHIQYN